MEAICPQCQARVEVPAPGVYRCGRCNNPFQIGTPAAPAPTPDFGAVPPPPAPGFAQPPPPPVPPPFAAPPPAAIGSMPAGAGMPWGVPAMVPSIDPNVHAPCAYHPANAATRTCERCGDFMCQLCTTFVEGRYYCPRCFDLLYTRGSLQFTQRQFTLPGVTLALGLSGFLTSLFCMCIVGVPLSIAGIFTSINALKQYRERPELPNRGMTNFGLVFSVLGILTGLAWGGWWAWLITKGQ